MIRAAFLLLACLPLSGGVLVCNANCLSKIASVVAIAANGKALIAGGKKGAAKIAHPKRKATVQSAKRTK